MYCLFIVLGYKLGKAVILTIIGVTTIAYQCPFSVMPKAFIS